MKQPVTKEVRKKLDKYGFKLEHNISDNTFTVELTESKLDKLKDMFSVYGLAEIEATDKMTENLYRGDLPPYVKDGSYVKVVVMFYENIEYKNAVSWIKSVGGIILSNPSKNINYLKISIHPSNLLNLANLDIVQYIEEVPPPQKNENFEAGKLSNVFWDNDGGTISGLYDKDYSDNQSYYLKGN